eukprot:354458-Chlamydomonas_euryale.AAC.1
MTSRGGTRTYGTQEVARCLQGCQTSWWRPTSSSLMVAPRLKQPHGGASPQAASWWRLASSSLM